MIVYTSLYSSESESIFICATWFSSKSGSGRCTGIGAATAALDDEENAFFLLLSAVHVVRPAAISFLVCFRWSLAAFAALI